MAATAETLAFQAETKELLRLMIHSLYTRKDIFLRELISNASDALDRLRFESLTNQDLLEGNDKFEIRLDVDRTARTLTISDSGIGMSRDEIIANIGTIAKSGTAELRQRLQEAGSTGDITELIGQFGVGFYSSFMVADRVKLVTRRAGQAAAFQWESDGSGTYEISETEKPERGTSITLYLKKPDADTGIEDYTDYWRLSSIVKLHSDFINYPIVAKKEREPAPGAEETGAPKEIVIEDSTLNSMKPIWKRSPAEVTAEDYTEFYKHVSHDWNEPLKTIHFKAEGTFEYDALLYIPAKAPYDLFYVGFEPGLRLYAKRVMIMEKCEDLLPHYLRFIRGIVDAADLPLNISRQRLQQDHHIALIRKRVTRKILDTLQELFDKDYEKYLKVWEEFGRSIKEGVSSDYENKDRILPLLLFQSSNDPEKLTTLKDYVGRMKPEQEQIFYLTGESRSVIENSPHLEALREKGWEVLYMTDPVDELVTQHLNEFENKKLKSVGKGVIKLGTDEEKEQAEKELKEKQEEYKPLIEFLQKRLDEHVKQVRLSTRLTTSPACLVVEEHDYSPMLERVLQKGKGGGPKQRRVLELNPKHPLIARLHDRQAANAEDPLLGNAAELVFGLAVLAEGSELPDPVRFNRAATEVLGQIV
ncbi:MAG TPA: molecular chaperone HtpG [Bryobacteraceae bacterium]|jgi:molecular chaperone HtpG|nr:molecular chaperone HtpG [Bryobacteraceae bacterium]